MLVYLNGTPTRAAEGSSLQALLERAAPPRQPYAVALNLAFVPRARHALTLLREGDRVELVVAAQGG